MKNISYLLHKLTFEELSALHKILGTKNNGVNQILDNFGKILLPVNGYLQSPLTYSQILQKIALNKNIQLLTANSEVANEQHLFLEMFQIEYAKMSEEEKTIFLQDLESKGLNKNQVASLTAIGTIGMAQASGFGVYILASSTVGAITSVLGITLPFAFYTGLSSVISFAIGPIGFLVLGYALYKSFKEIRSFDDVISILSQSYTGIKNLFTGNYEKATLCFKYIAAMRVVLQKRIEEKLSDSMSKYDMLNNDCVHLKIERDNNAGTIHKFRSEIQKHETIIMEHRREIEQYSVTNASIEIQLENSNDQLSELKQTIINTEIELTEYTNKFK
jgi:hypothetical protein